MMKIDYAHAVMEQPYSVLKSIFFNFSASHREKKIMMYVPKRSFAVKNAFFGDLPCLHGVAYQRKNKRRISVISHRAMRRMKKSE